MDMSEDTFHPEDLTETIWRQKNYQGSNGNLSNPVPSSLEIYDSVQELVLIRFDQPCLLATKLAAKHQCLSHPGQSDCKCPRKIFQSRKHSKRNTHVYRKLLSFLGPDFPIPDSLLSAIKPYLDCLCDNGLSRNTFHMRSDRCRIFGVCLNEAHYQLVGDQAGFLEAFKTALEVAFLPHEQERFAGLEELLRDSSLSFEQLCLQLKSKFKISEMASNEDKKMRLIVRPRKNHGSKASPTIGRRHPSDSSVTKPRVLKEKSAKQAKAPRGPRQKLLRQQASMSDESQFVPAPVPALSMMAPVMHTQPTHSSASLATPATTVRAHNQSAPRANQSEPVQPSLMDCLLSFPSDSLFLDSVDLFQQDADLSSFASTASAAASSPSNTTAAPYSSYAVSPVRATSQQMQDPPALPLGPVPVLPDTVSTDFMTDILSGDDLRFLLTDQQAAALNVASIMRQYNAEPKCSEPHFGLGAVLGNPLLNLGPY